MWLIAKLSALCMTILLITACTTVPAVIYSKVEAPKEGGNEALPAVSDSFYLNKSQIVIALQSSPANASPSSTSTITFVSQPVEHRAFKVGIRPNNTWRATTNVNITKVANTDRVDSIGIDTTDNTVKLIGELGGIVGKIVAFATPAGAPGVACISPSHSPLRLDLDPSKGIEETFNGDGTRAGDGQKGCISVTYDPLPPGHIKTIDLPVGTPSSHYFYSACRDATVTFIQGTRRFSEKVRIADPNALQPVQFPFKGTIQMHSECGASVVTDKNAAPATTTQIVDALLVQGKAIKEAIEASKK